MFIYHNENHSVKKKNQLSENDFLENLFKIASYLK